jgi:chemotaxis family two-component system sensor kinase Cph1
MSTSLYPTGPAASPRPRVLLVENDPLIAMTVADQLAELGYAVAGPGYSLAQACELAADAAVDAALVDWNLDATNAADVADILARRQIPFVFVTGYSEIPDARYRKIRLLTKPFSMEILGRTVEELLGGD